MAIDYASLRDRGLILFEAIVGSQAYGTNTATSDEDRQFVYMLPLDAHLGLGYVDQVEVTKDCVGWELRRFLELLRTSNPTALELLFSPADCIVTKHEVFDLLLDVRDAFVTRACEATFAGYARQQIKKATGLEKKQNWEKDQTERKTPLDFCWVIEGQSTFRLAEFLARRGIEIARTGATRLQHARDVYALYYDPSPDGALGYRGILKETASGELVSNELRLSAVPAGASPIAIFSYNASEYSRHCKGYREYQTWLQERNTARWVDTQKHGQKIDGKNMMHCKRLLRMACEIAAGRGVVVRRPDAEELLAVRRGEVSLSDLLDEANARIAELPELFARSGLPDGVETSFVDGLLVRMRRRFYGLDS